MATNSRINPTAAALAATALAAAFLVLAVVQATHGTFDDELTSTVDYVNDASFAVALVVLVPSLIAVRHGRRTPGYALEGAIVGALLVALGVIAGLVLGHSPSWFAAVGVPGNLLLLVSTVRLARAIWREREWPRWFAVAVGLTVPCGVILADIGADAILAIAWAYAAGRLTSDVTAAPATADGSAR